MSSRTFPGSLVLVGAGKMGASLLEGWLAAGLPSGAVTILEPRPSPELQTLVDARGLSLNPASADMRPPDLLVLAIKPQLLAEVGPGLRGIVGAATLVVSILAGKTIAGLSAALGGHAAIVRAMPNLPASIGRGATGIYAAPAVTSAQRAMAETLLAANGSLEWVAEEEMIDAVTALSGSGPAYVFHLVECLAGAGARAGLDPGVAARLALATVIGAGELLRVSGTDPARLRENVTSPGGTTAAALAILMGGREPGRGGLGALIEEAVMAAKMRAGELAG